MAKGEPQVRVAVVGDASQLKRALESAELSLHGFDKAFASVSTKTVALGAAMGGALLNVGTQVVDMVGQGLLWLPKLGAEFDSVADHTRVFLGNNQETLAAVDASFRDLLPKVASPMSDIGQVLDTVYGKLGYTGKAAETLSAQMLDLSRMTGTDLGQNVTNLTDAFNLWGISGDQAISTMDLVYRAFTNTQTPVTDIAEGLGAASVQLQVLGFSMEDVVALSAGLGKVGLNVGDINKSLNRMIKEHPGEELTTIFDDMVAGIQDGSITLEQVMYELGNKGGASFFQLAKSGKLNFGDLKAAILGGTDSIDQANKDTEDWPEKWAKVWNGIQLAIEPAATWIFDTLGGILDVLVTRDAEGNVTYNLAGAWDEVAKKWGEAWAVIQPVLATLWANLQVWWNDPKTQDTLKAIGSNLGGALATGISEGLKAILSANFKEWGIKSLLTAMGFGWAVGLFEFLGIDIGGDTPGTPEAPPALPPDYLSNPSSKYLTGKALGGSVVGGRPYLVGERGPELFVPRASGRIVANGKSGGDVNHFNIYATEPRATALEIIRQRRAATFLAGAA